MKLINVENAPFDSTVMDVKPSRETMKQKTNKLWSIFNSIGVIKRFSEIFLIILLYGRLFYKLMFTIIKWIHEVEHELVIGLSKYSIIKLI